MKMEINDIHETRTVVVHYKGKGYMTVIPIIPVIPIRNVIIYMDDVEIIKETRKEKMNHAIG